MGKERGSDDDSDDEQIFASDKKRDQWFKRYKLHMVKMVQLKECGDVPSLDLQITLSELVFSLQKHFKSKQIKNIIHWNSKLTQRNRRKSKKSLNEDALSQPHLYLNHNRTSKRKRKRDGVDLMDDTRDNKKRKGNSSTSSEYDKLDKIWAFDYPPYAFNWSDRCSICQKGGKLILCEGPCVGSFHIKCLGLKKEPDDDPWFCTQCKILKEKREETYKLTGGKSSRFKPDTYSIKVWMDNNNDDPYDVYKVETSKELKAKCFYPSEKSKKSKKSKRKKKRTRSQMQNE